jgi:hypothetical protein
MARSQKAQSFSSELILISIVLKYRCYNSEECELLAIVSIQKNSEEWELHVIYVYCSIARKQKAQSFSSELVLSGSFPQ